MNNEYKIGERIREVRKRKGYSQTKLADLLGKSLRTIQKYESGEIELSIAMVNQIARVLDTSSTYLLDNNSADVQLNSMADVMGYLFQLEKAGLHFSIDVKKPPHHDNWECSIVFNGKDRTSEHNADVCLFLEDWQEKRKELENDQLSYDKYEKWKDQTLAYYAYANLLNNEPENK